MAKLEIKLTSEEWTRLRGEAIRNHLSLEDWARNSLLNQSLAPEERLIMVTTETGEVISCYDWPEDMGQACAEISQDALVFAWSHEKNAASD